MDPSLQIESLSRIWGYSQMQEIQVQGGMWPSWPVNSSVGGRPLSWAGTHTLNFEPDPWVYSLVPWARLVQSSRAGGEMKVAGRFVPTVSVRVGLTSAVLVSVALAHPRSLQTFEWLMAGLTLLITLAGATAHTWHVPSDFFSTNLAFSCKCILC